MIPSWALSNSNMEEGFLEADLRMMIRFWKFPAEARWCTTGDQPEVYPTQQHYLHQNAGSSKSFLISIYWNTDRGEKTTLFEERLLALARRIFKTAEYK